MALLKCNEREDLLSKQKNDLSGFVSVTLKGFTSGIEIPVYCFCDPSPGSDYSSLQLSFSSDGSPTLLDSLLLAKWEDLAWKNLIQYDVTACPTRIISGEKKFSVQLNENLETCSGITGTEQFSTYLTLDMINICSDDILFCVERGDKDMATLIPSVEISKDSIFVIVNATPVEYGHVFLFPNQSDYPAHHFDSLGFILQIASEIRNSSFRIFYDQNAISKFGHAYFQAWYIVNPLAVERRLISPLYHALGEQIAIFEVMDYPIRTLMFNSNTNFKLLSTVISEMCFFLTSHSISFNLLLSDHGRKVFLFLQAGTKDNHLSAWECAGSFVFSTACEFSQVDENAILQKMAAVSLDRDTFQEVKQTSCSIANKLASALQCSFSDAGSMAHHE